MFCIQAWQISKSGQTVHFGVRDSRTVHEQHRVSGGPRTLNRLPMTVVLHISQRASVCTTLGALPLLIIGFDFAPEILRVCLGA